ncbi:MAG: hypothetical protein ACREUE_13030, partial [Panacagrimonas sp.]
MIALRRPGLAHATLTHKAEPTAIAHCPSPSLDRPATVAPSKRNLIDVPRDLDTVTHFEPSTETRDTDVGLKANAVDKIWNAVRAMYRTG